jgi:hypothetical protein
VLLEHRIPNVIYSEPPMSLWKRFALRVIAIIGSLLFVSLLLKDVFGDFSVLMVGIIFFAVAIPLAIWSERRKRRLRRQKGVAQRAR